jgi:hypothetical protein
MERRIEGTLIDLNHALGRLLQPPRDAIAVQRLQGDRLENQQVKGSLRQVRFRVGH